MFNDKGILVEISAQSIGSKIIRIEAMNKEASDWLNQSVLGILAEGGDATDSVKHYWSHYVRRNKSCDTSADFSYNAAGEQDNEYYAEDEAHQTNNVNF